MSPPASHSVLKHFVQIHTRLTVQAELVNRRQDFAHLPMVVINVAELVAGIRPGSCRN